MAGSTIVMWSYREDLLDPGDIGGYSIHAIDGDIGKVDKHDIETGRSYLLVSTGPWIFGKTVMLPAGVTGCKSPRPRIWLHDPRDSRCGVCYAPMSTTSAFASAARKPSKSTSSFR